MRLLPFLFLALVATGCAGVTPLAAGPRTTGPTLARAIDPLDLASALARFTTFEQRKVTAAHIPDNNGHGGATLAVALDAAERTELVQLYRLEPQASDVATWPAGLIGRAADHLAVTHHYQLPADPALSAADMGALVKPRAYLDGHGQVWAYEAFINAGTYRMAAKYDLSGRLLQVDMDTWQPVP